MKNFYQKIELHKNWLNKNNFGKQLDIENESISDLNIIGEDINTAIYTKINFKNSIFKNSNLGVSYFYDCIFHHINFTDVFFRKSEFYDCSFTNSNLTKIEFNNVFLNNCNIIDSDLGWSFFNESK